ncbi:YadA-like family protein [Halomonas mongoliensis]|uniref:YadA-like family protein n=1 Tax=Halomonas mongoliensis TaxID=321265 RepID=UPI00403A7EBE
MNKVFRIIWNRTLGRLVVASEAARSQGKSGVEHLQVAPMVAINTPPMGRLRPLALAIGLAAAGAATPAAIAQDATYDNVTVNNQLVVSGTAILSALEVSGSAAFDGPLTVGGVSVATASDIDGLDTRVGVNEAAITGLDGRVDANETAITGLDGRVDANETAITGLDGRVDANETAITGLDGRVGASETAIAGLDTRVGDNESAIAAVEATASAGWDISAEGNAGENVAPGGAVDFSGDGNIEVGRDGTNLTFSLADEIEVASVSAGDVTLGTSGLTISGGPSVTSGGIDAGGQRITNVAAGDLSADSTDAIVGSQIFDLFIEEGAGGVRYFRARSAQPDSEALGNESIAIGPNTVAEGESSLAAGDGARTAETAAGAIALGEGASVGTEDGAVDDGEGSIAIGRDSQASGTRTLALGDGAAVEDERVEDAMALGTGAVVSGMESDRALAAGFEANASSADATAVGASASASGGSSTALGAGSDASGGSSIALGDNASASAGGALAAGAGSVAATADSISLGTGAGVGTLGDAGGDRTDHIAIGRASGQSVAGNQNTAIGLQAGSSVEGDQNVAIGTRAGQGLLGNRNVALGHEANLNAGAVDRATAIGGQTSAARDAVAVGYEAEAEDSGVALGTNTSAGSAAVALGRNAEAEGGSVALGAGSAAVSSDAGGAGYLTGSSFSDGTVVSVGNTESGQSRRIVNVADGAQDLDAVNVGQLKGAQQSVATLIGGGVVLNPDGTYSPITVQNTDGDDVTFTTVVEAIGAVTSGEVDILPVDAVRYNAEGGISNLSAGVNATDAVNVEQLNEAVAESGVKYFSVNSTEPANRDNTLASGTDALAIGPATSADGSSSLAAGHLAKTVGDQSVALGYRVEALGNESTAIGSRSEAYGDGGVAIGQRAVSEGENSIVIGTRAEADPKADGTVDNAIVIGTEAEATADNGIAIGERALASEDRAVAQGFNAEASAEDAQAHGSRSRATGVSSQASGTDARASGVNAQASGTDARASGTSSIATGTDARGYASDGIAMGTGARSGLANPLPEEAFRNTNGIAIGNSSLADNRNALALGVEAQAREESSTALGDSAEATAVDALAVGSSARSTAGSASALGEGAEATHERSVALGAGSTTSAPIGTSGATIDKVDYNYAGADPVATVSVGSEGEERTITNVAAGRVSAASTDAINGSQLYGTNMALESLADDLDTAGASVADVLGGNAAYDPETHQVTTSNVGGTGEDTVHDAIEYAAQGWDVSANGADSENVAPGGSVDFSNTDDNIVIARDGTDLTFGLSDELEIASSITVGDTVIDGDSLATSNLDVGGGTFVVEGDNVTYGGNEVATQADGLSFAGNTGGTIDKTLGDSSPLTISGGLASSEASSGANLRVDSDGDQLNLVMARNLTDLDSITINDGPVIDSAGVTIGDVNLDDSGLTIAGGPSVTDAGIDAGDQVVSNVAPGVDGSDAVNVDQLGEVSEVANRGWNISANGEDEPANVAPGGTVDFASSDENIVITRDGTDLDFALADDLTGLESIGLNGIDGADGLTIRGGDGAPGTPGLDGEDGITRIIYEGADGTPYEVATMDDGLVFAGNTGDDIARKLGETLTISGELEEGEDATGANLRVDSDGDQLNLVMARNLTDLDSITINDGPVIDSAGVTIGDVNLDDSGLTIAGGPSVTDAGIDAGDQVVSNVAPGVDGSDAVNVDQLGEVSEVANRGWNISANGEDEPANVAPGGTVDFASSDENIVITRDGTDLDFALADDLTGLESIGLNGIDGADGLTIRGGDGAPGTPGLDGEDGITRIIYEGADGTPYEVATMDDGLVFAGNTGDDIARKLGETLTISGELEEGEDATGANLRVDSDGDQLNLVMARNLTDLDSITINDGPVIDSAGVTIGDVNLDDSGLTIAGGPSVTDAGIDAGDQVVSNVAPGVDGSDSVNVDQLGEVSEVANRGWNISANGEDEPANVAPGGTVDFASSDENIVITRDGTDLDFALADDLTGLESIGLNGIDGADGLTIRGGDGAPGAPGLDGEDGITRIIYEDADGTPYEVATMDDGLVFAGNTGDDIARKLGETLTISGELEEGEDATGANLRVDSDGDQLNLVMARNLTDLDSITINDGPVIDSAGVTIGDVNLDDSGLTIAGGPSVTDAGIDAGDQVVSNVAPGVDGSDAVNVDQLGEVSEVANRGWNISAQGGSETNVAPGGSVDLNNADGNLVLTKVDDSNDVTFDLAENIDLGEDGSVTTGDTVLNNDGVTVAGASSNDPSTTIGAGSIEVAGSGATPNTVIIDGEAGTVSGLTNQTLDAPDFADGSGRAASEEQLELVNQTANAGWNLTGSGADAVNIGPNGAVDFRGDANLSVAQSGIDDDGQIDITLNRDLDLDSVTTGDTVMDSAGVRIGDVDGDGASTEVGAGTIILAANPTTGPANEVIIDANTGTIGGLTNRDFDPDSFVSGQAATEDQLGQVYTVANAGWNVSVGGEGALEDGSNNVGPESVVDFSNTDGNILIDRDGTDLAFSLNPELDLGEEGRVTIGGTVMDDDGVRVGDNVQLGEDGLVIAGGPSVTDAGIDAGDQVITSVAAGEVSETSTDAINGSQLYAVQNIAESGWSLSGSGENAVNIGPNGAVDFQGDSNITVSQAGVDQDGVIEVALNDSITLGEGDNAVTVDGENGRVSVGDTIMNGDGISVGDDVHLGSAGLVINGGPSVTTSGIDAGGMRITNLMAGVEATDAVNVSQLNEGVAAATTEVTAGSNISVSESTGDNGQTIYTVETQRDVNFDSIEVGTVNIDQNNVDENGNTIITGVGRGEVSENSTDAVNGSQLWDVQQELGDINESLDGGMNFAADEGDAVNRRLGDTMAVSGDDNITTRTTGDGVQVTMNRDLDVDSVTTGRTTVSDQGVTIDGGPSMTVDGIDGGGMRITNVAPGVDATDAVNVGQMQELNQRFANEINNVHGRIDNVERNANAGTASALAAGTVPQAWMPGKSMVGVGAGTYEGESAVSVGVSRLSDNGRWIIQGKVTGDSQSNFGAGVGAGWHW